MIFCVIHNRTRQDRGECAHCPSPSAPPTGSCTGPAAGAAPAQVCSLAPSHTHGLGGMLPLRWLQSEWVDRFGVSDAAESEVGMGYYLG